MSNDTRTRTLFFVVDTSNSMINDIGVINHAFDAGISIVRIIQEKYPKLLFKINILEFSDHAEWQMPIPADVSCYQWRNLETYGVDANFGEVCKELNDKLSFDEFMGNSIDSAIILLINSPLDNVCETELKELENESRFKQAMKKTLVYGEDLEDNDINTLKEFTGGDVCMVPRVSKILCKQIIKAVAEAALYGLDVDNNFIQQCLSKAADECDCKYPIWSIRDN